MSTNSDPIDVLKEDIDDVVRWAAGLNDTIQRCHTLLEFASVAADNRNPKIIRIKALHAIRAMPPHNRESDQGLPYSVLQSALTEILRLRLEETDPELNDEAEYVRRTLMNHIESTILHFRSVRVRSSAISYQAASFDSSQVEGVVRQAVM